MKRIPLSQGLYALVDDEDFERLSKFKWSITRRGGHYYASRVVSMHREIMGTPLGMVTDHVNHDGLDNRKQNLRVCTKTQNRRNLRGAQVNSKSGILGVSWNKTRKKWCGCVQAGGRRALWIEFFGTKRSAWLAVVRKRRELFGEFCGT